MCWKWEESHGVHEMGGYCVDPTARVKEELVRDDREARGCDMKEDGCFAGLGFLTWYLAGKIRVFNRRGHVAKLCILLVPLLCASLVAISRVDDYWHHWQDVSAGGLLGLVVSSVIYLQFYPPPYDVNGWAPHAYFRMLVDTRNNEPPATNSARPGEVGTVNISSDQMLDDMEEGSGSTSGRREGTAVRNGRLVLGPSVPKLPVCPPFMPAVLSWSSLNPKPNKLPQFQPGRNDVPP
ncbi:Lipid phosphate phosphatase 2 [Platanthera guangdongensis]|uniref:Lipid phosphate phosphatase 2 n=1 Tax=Platanthera guangdongensis TaxID=2320717 RepID=A0ABR2M4B9_9ASPA